MVDFDPGNNIAHNNLASAQWSLAESYWAKRFIGAGRYQKPTEALTFISKP